jgi:hypothetical protein
MQEANGSPNVGDLATATALNLHQDALDFHPDRERDPALSNDLDFHPDRERDPVLSNDGLN